MVLSMRLFTVAVAMRYRNWSSQSSRCAFILHVHYNGNIGFEVVLSSIRFCFFRGISLVRKIDWLDLHDDKWF